METDASPIYILKLPFLNQCYRYESLGDLSSCNPRSSAQFAVTFAFPGDGIPGIHRDKFNGMAILYRHDLRPEAAAIARLYDSAGLIRPTRDLDRIRRMYAGSNVVWTAWDPAQNGAEAGNAEGGGRLAGILRGWTDGAYDGYVCDLAVHADYQKQGIGRELLARVAAHHGRQVQWVLRAAPIAKTYYQHLGWKPIENGWYVPREEWR
jgi:GNAT superfamily N-acetyltransferase